MGEHNSPYFDAGVADGKRDETRIRSCPPRAAVGMDPQREWSWMYKRGYEREFTGRVHSCQQCASRRR